MVVESKSFYNRFVDFAFFVVKNWKTAKDAESAKEMVKELGNGKVSPDDRREESPKFACAVGVRLPDEQREEPRRGRKGSSDALAGVMGVGGRKER